MNNLISFYQQKIAPFRQQWRMWLIILIVAAILSTVPFWFSDLDISIASYFYQSTANVPEWPYRKFPLWDFFYYTAPIFATLLGLIGIEIIILGSIKPHWRRWRLYGWFILLTVALGPGLLVNIMLKDHWGRPRPCEIETFGKNATYLPPLVPDFSSDSKSFPCGHCSVAFSFAVFYFILSSQWPIFSKLILIASLIAAGLVGISRMAAGGHFLSDVLWSGVLTYMVMIGLYFFGLTIPAREREFTIEVSTIPEVKSKLASWQVGLTLIAITLLIFIALLATPFEKDIHYILPVQGNKQISSIQIHAPGAATVVTISKTQPKELIITGNYTGFGFPWNRIKVSDINHGHGKIEVFVIPQGMFSELKGELVVTYNPNLIGGKVRVME